MKENYLSKKQQESLVTSNSKKNNGVQERTMGTYCVSYNGAVLPGNPYQGNTKESNKRICERNLFISEARGK